MDPVNAWKEDLGKKNIYNVTYITLYTYITRYIYITYITSYIMFIYITVIYITIYIARYVRSVNVNAFYIT